MSLYWDQFDIKGLEGRIDINNLARMVLALFPEAKSMKVARNAEGWLCWLDLEAYRVPGYHFDMLDSREQKVSVGRTDLLRIQWAKEAKQ